jgi:hypothetical protein
MRMCVALLAVMVAAGHDARADENPASPAARLTVIDATPAFWKFWRTAAGKPEDVRVQMFIDHVVAANPELFESDVLNSAAVTGSPPPPEAGSIVARYLHDVEPYIDTMRRLSATLRDSLDAYARDFTTTFPDYAPRTPVYFTVSLFSFDGATREVGDSTALLFGIDGIARFHAPGSNLKVFFDHELFHQYHDQVAPELSVDDAPLWMSLWEEGLATWVGRQMNAGSSEADALMSDTLAGAAGPMLPALARELLENFASTDPKEYAAFFFGANGRPDLPPRCGYYVGYRVAQQLAAGRTLRQLAALHGPELEAAVRGALDELAKPR